MAIDPRKFGPTRGELIFRLVVSCLGLAFLLVAVAITGIPTGPAFGELFGVAGLFLGGTIIWSARRLILRLHP